ncbi:putative transmembrane domain protein, partial [Chlamydia psittaci C1/97]
DLIS